ncbi:hypothetical protein COY32_00255 [candidate division WWE3 bacterium CG_4_10_14_0_2_um_filter_41_14]|uniref:Uncharacterized protein n=1 Tax=candidate division WWE3 bacterium CG_4_10_14_0_2_um_filter_41_14 TaxID=1975072 RepID=A0A2M7TM12_UNCKA|nr:MAG: hypothetical protein COY32_00255 [candidate division WWE3 bacterium CG_4_10_14_0_2_um_filter_41_14]
MNRQTTVTIVISVVFVLIIGVFEFIHWQVETVPSVVDPTYLQTFDVDLPQQFVDDLKSREGHEVGPDLEY